MRLFEILLFAALLLSVSAILFLKDTKYRIVVSALSIVLSVISIIAEGLRFAMIPAYLLAFILLTFSVIRMLIKRRKRHPILKSCGIAAFCLAYVMAIVLPSFLPVINLPTPGGSSLVGTMRLDFTEPARKDIMTDKTSVQKIAVQVWYPAANTNGKKRATWMDNRRTASLFAQAKGLPDVFGQLDLIKTNSFWNAPFSSTIEKYPVILFSDGLGMFNGQNTIQMEELASQGFVVFAVSHPYDDFATVYADGSIVPSSTNQLHTLSKDSMQALVIAKKQVADDSTPEFQRVVIENAKLNTEEIRIWSADMRFIADEIIKLNDGSIASIFKGKLDIKKMGIFGHSFGGATAGETCLLDSRFKACINMDGMPFGDTVNHVITQPLMVFTEGSDRNLKFVPSAGYANGQKNFLTVSIHGAQHMNFTDFNVIIPNIGKALGALGTINANRQTEIMNTYIVSFFNKYLKDMQEPLLDASSSQYSEVTIEKK